MAEINELETMARLLRSESIRSTTAAGSGHPTTCLSAAEIVSVLFFSELRRNDEFVLSKGHAAPLLWAALAEAGLIERGELLNLRKVDSPLEGHPTPRLPLVKVATGSLGQGLSAAVGLALSRRLENRRERVYVLLGDGELAEGSVWEAANAAAHYRLNNLCAIVDVNRLGQSQETMHGHDLEPYRRKFKAFGWKTLIVDGHAVPELLAAFRQARRSAAPCAIIARTVKGKGVSFLEDRDGWHGKPLNAQEMAAALAELGEVSLTLPARVAFPVRESPLADFEPPSYKPGEMVATRAAFGQALVRLGRACDRVVAIDGDVRNSTMMEEFFKEFPGRSLQSYIAEQNMVGMAMGLSAGGFLPVVATFSAFLSRAFDFIRMAVYSQANIKFVGSHSGVSIGADGPSQMGLEDLAMFLVLPDTLVFYPADAVSTTACFRQMVRQRGISYLRTTREKTPVIYPAGETFAAGGLKVLRRSGEDRALVLAAGITLHEALKAHDILRQRSIAVRLADLYCLKPLPEDELIGLAEGRLPVVVVEDHYDFGIGRLVASVLPRVTRLSVRQIPRSGQPQELLEKYGISAGAIVRAVEAAL